MCSRSAGAVLSQISSWKNRLDAAMAARLGEGFTPWRLHDLRRTAASGMTGIGIAPHVVEAALNHKSGDGPRDVFPGALANPPAQHHSDGPDDAQARRGRVDPARGCAARRGHGWPTRGGVRTGRSLSCPCGRNAVLQAYQRSKMLERRRPVMQAWASFLT